MRQKEYHNYPIGSIIYPRDNSYQKLLSKNIDWDGEDHSGDLYIKPCKVMSEEYSGHVDMYGIHMNHYFVDVEYKGGIYKVCLSEYIDLSVSPDWIDELEDMYGEYPFDYVW